MEILHGLHGEFGQCKRARLYIYRNIYIYIYIYRIDRINGGTPKETTK